MNSDKSFYLGYYVHLITDILWKVIIYRPTKEKYFNLFSNEAELNYRIKADWGDAEYLFLRDNPNFRTLKIFRSVTTFPNRYFDYYSDISFESKISEISSAYNTVKDNLDREYPYLNMRQADTFVNKAIEVIKKDLIIKGVI